MAKDEVNSQEEDFVAQHTVELAEDSVIEENNANELPVESQMFNLDVTIPDATDYLLSKKKGRSIGVERWGLNEEVAQAYSPQMLDVLAEEYESATDNHIKSAILDKIRQYKRVGKFLGFTMLPYENKSKGIIEDRKSIVYQDMSNNFIFTMGQTVHVNRFVSLDEFAKNNNSELTGSVFVLQFIGIKKANNGNKYHDFAYQLIEPTE